MLLCRQLFNLDGRQASDERRPMTKIERLEKEIESNLKHIQRQQEDIERLQSESLTLYTMLAMAEKLSINTLIQ